MKGVILISSLLYFEFVIKYDGYFQALILSLEVGED
jgi:hypothetical protein